MLRLRNIATLLVIMLMTAVSASAQKNIDNAVAALIKKYPDAQTAYTEYRTPKTHKLERVTRIISMSDQAEYTKLLRALEADAAESVRFSKAGGIVTARFEDDDKVANYSLVQAKNNGQKDNVVLPGVVRAKNNGQKDKVVLPGVVFDNEDDNWLLSITIRSDAD